jgi:tetratricopeptide (TPR) repeat protein
LKQDSKANNQTSEGQDQTKLFERAVKHFHAQEFAKAKVLFEQAAAGPVVEIAHAAQMHIRMCDRRIGNKQTAPKSPEDLYAHSIAFMNQGLYAQAEPLLKKAVSASPESDHFLYALALCQGHMGDLNASAASLRRAIELQPSNRISAKRDADFQSLLADGPVRDLVLGERS